MNFIILLFALATSFVVSNAATDKVFCYVGNWETYRYGNGKFSPNNVNPNLCTHVVYAFIVPNAQGKVQLLDSWIDTEQGGFSKFKQLKAINPNVKLLVSLGGYNQGSVEFSAIVNSASLRASLAYDLAAFLKSNGFDGLDVNWQYPAKRGGTVLDKNSFVAFLSDLKTAFAANKYLLTISVSGNKDYIAPSYDIYNINGIVDYYNIMAYDIPTKTYKIATHSSALYPSKLSALASDSLNNVDAAIRAWIEAGASPTKILLGISLAGRTHTLSSTTGTLASSYTGDGHPGRYTHVGGSMTYLETCELLKAGGWTTVFDNDQRVPYSTRGNQFIAHENAESIRQKAAYAKTKNLAGVTVFSLGSEDYNNVCGGGKYPLLNAVQDGFSSTQTTTTTKPTTTTTTKPTTTTVKTTQSPTGTIQCPASGYYIDPTNCSSYYRCSPTDSSVPHLRYSCPKTTVFVPESKVCAYGTCD